MQTEEIAGLTLDQEQSNKKFSSLLSGLAKALESEEQDSAIRRAFRDIYDREPITAEFRRYRHLMHEEHWTEREIRDDLRSRYDYRRYTVHRDLDPARS